MDGDEDMQVPRSANRRLRDRVAGLALLTGSLGVLGVAYGVSPASAGVGTHTQLGLSPCGFLAATGLPCATCGMTTATSLAAHGRLLAAGLTQPAGLLFALGLGAAFWVGAWLLISGRPSGRVFAGFGRAVFSGRGLLAGLVIVGGSWAYKVAVVLNAAPAASTVHPGSLPGA